MVQFKAKATPHRTEHLKMKLLLGQVVGWLKLCQSHIRYFVAGFLVSFASLSFAKYSLSETLGKSLQLFHYCIRRLGFTCFVHGWPIFYLQRPE